MGLRFRKSISLGKGARINIGKSGIGGSIGGKGLRVGIGPKGLRSNVGIPGTGISYETTSGKSKNSSDLKNSMGNIGCLLPTLVLAALAFIFLPLGWAIFATGVVIVMFWMA